MKKCWQRKDGPKLPKDLKILVKENVDIKMVTRCFLFKKTQCMAKKGSWLSSIIFNWFLWGDNGQGMIKSYTILKIRFQSKIQCLRERSNIKQVKIKTLNRECVNWSINECKNDYEWMKALEFLSSFSCMILIISFQLLNYYSNVCYIN